ncbi:LacI family transcriptional regulator/LacI family purine nucleotide synthesis repressor [Cohnella sp. SGD-V74]|uniref:LacI family DNA-binding transcriptional regulator n=1 Tax=unclassified Cohnella TaxID=2636738 RepID=UPI000D49DB81|nr:MULTISPECIES: substrate-binding domain-containing protein [unclassified Cohnella]PRX74339.1 LacI family transcriptional regulator/LacI family purine nucleotide synthesis repressor [Cohnella sp. SGD-V74]
MNGSRKKPTMQHIADKLGISKSLVSRALAGDAQVSDRTKEQVRLTAMELGYPINSSAAAVPSSRTGNVAVLMPRAHLRDAEFWGKVVGGTEEELHRSAFSLVLGCIATDEPVKSGLPSCITDRKVDGAIVMGRVPVGYIAEVLATGIPVVLADVMADGLKLDHVLADNYRGGYEAASLLLQKGHRKLLFAGDPGFSYSFAERKRGAERAVAQFEPQDGTEAPSLSFVDSALLEDQWLTLPGEEFAAALKGDVTAVVCANDSIAFAALERLAELGLRCPQDVSVVGFDNVERCEWVTPSLTSVDAGKTTIGKRAVELLLRRMEHPEERPETLYIATEMVERNSVAEHFNNFIKQV